MHFLHPAFLGFLLPLLGIPLLIHLFNRKFPQKIYFSSVENIKKSIAQRSKLFRWRHLVMTAVRTLLLLLLVFVFLKPILARFGGDPLADSQRHVLIIFDHSLSMEHESNLLTCRKRGILEASKIIDNLEPDDRLNVIAASRRPSTCFFDFTNNHTEALSFLEALPRGTEIADFNKANASAGQMLSKIEAPGEIYFISDFQRRNWANVSFENIPPETRFFFVDVGVEDRHNRGILSAAIDRSIILAGEAIKLKLELGNFTPHLFEDTVQVVVDGSPAIDTEVSVPAWSEKTVSLDLTAPGPGLHLVEVHLPEDDLPVDDHRHLTARVLDKEEVVFITDQPDLSAQGGRFLKVAMNPYQNLAGSLLPRQLPSADLNAANLVTSTKAVLTGVAPLRPEQADALIGFLARGGGVIYFLDGDHDPTNLLTLDDALGENTLPLRLVGRQQVDPTAAEGAPAHRFSRGNFRSPFLKLFRGSHRQNLALLEFYDIYHAVSDDKDSVLLYYADGTPAMTRSYIGLGTLLLCNFSVSELDSNLARQQIFPAWVQELIKNISATEALDESYEVGSEIAAEVWQDQLKDQDILAPDQTPARLNRELNGDRYFISFPAEQPGFYRLGKKIPPDLAFAVNCSGEESDLRPVDHSLLPQRVGDLNAESTSPDAHFVQGTADYAALKNGKPIFHYFLLGVLALLLIEMLLQKFFRSLTS